MLNIAILSSDTTHHRYFINRLIDNGFNLPLILFEQNHVSPPFKTGPFFKEEEEEFEKINFLKEVPLEIDSLNYKFVNTVNDKEVLSYFSNHKINFGIVFGTGLIKEPIINYFNGNLINIHRGVASEYRGLDSDLWAVYHDDFQNIGVTIHQVDSSLDTGDIICIERLNFLNDMKIFQLRYYTTIIATNLIIDTIQKALKGNLTFNKQKIIGKYYSFMPYDLKRICERKFTKFINNL